MSFKSKIGCSFIAIDVNSYYKARKIKKLFCKRSIEGEMKMRQVTIGGVKI